MDFFTYSCFLLGELGEPLVVPVCVLSDLPLLHLLDPLLHLHLVHESRKREDIRYLLFVTSTIVTLILKVLGIKTKDRFKADQTSKAINLALKMHIKPVQGSG